MLAIASWLTSICESLWALMPRQRKRLLLQKVTNVVDQHLAHLIRVRAETLGFDSSGRPQSQRWSDEIERFLNSQVMVTLSEHERRLLTRYQNDLRLFIAVRVARAAGSRGTQDAVAGRGRQDVAQSLLLSTERIRRPEVQVMSKQEILDAIDRATSPNTQTKAEALEWLQDLIADLEGRCEALRVELANEGPT